MNLYFETVVNGYFKDIRKAFNLELFQKLKIPGSELYIRSFEGTEKGDEVSFTMKIMGVNQYWEGLIIESVENDNESYFVDVGKDIPWPLESWTHKHSFVSIEGQQTKIIDDVDFTCSNKFLECSFYPIWFSYFQYRSWKYKQVFA